MQQSATVKALYERQARKREPFLRRARAAAMLTIPSLMPPEGFGPTDDLYVPYQGIGSYGVSVVSAKLLLALMPPNVPFFRNSVDDQQMVTQAGTASAKAPVEEALARYDRSIMSHFEASGFRHVLHESIQHLIVAGNGLIVIDRDNVPTFYSLDKYVVQRSRDGALQRVITLDSLNALALPEPVLRHLTDTAPDRLNQAQEGSLTKDIPLYSHYYREGGEWVFEQEVLETTVPDSVGSYSDREMPAIPLRWTSISGEDLGRGHVESVYGDLKTLEGLSKAVVEGAAISAELIRLVNPNGLTDVEDLRDAANGDFVPGRPEDIGSIQAQKSGDLSVAQNAIAGIERRLSAAFMLNSAVQRSGERVTAEEIRYVARELEDTFGGSFTLLSQELQLRLVEVVTANLERSKALPALPKGTVKTTVTTGIEALGRGQDLSRLDLFLQGLLNTVGPQVIAEYLNVPDYIKRRGAAVGIEMDGLVKSEEEVIAARQQAQMMAMAQSATPNAVNQLGQMAQKQMETDT